MTGANDRSDAAHIPRRRGRMRVLLLALSSLTLLPPAQPAQAGLYHYPWCEMIRDRCYAKAIVRKAECNWRYNYAKTHQLNGLSKWPKGTANFCYMAPGAPPS